MATVNDESVPKIPNFENFNDDPEFPCLHITGTLRPVEAFQYLLNYRPGDKYVCCKKPVAVTRPAVACDIKADDLGVWLHKGKPIRHYRIHGKI